MKKQRFFMLGIITVLVAVLSLTFVSSTFAKYTSTVEGTDTAKVAKWEWDVAGHLDGDDHAFTTVDLFNTAVYELNAAGNVTEADDADVVNGTDKPIIAPGTGGKATFVISNTSEVNAKFAIDFTVNEDDVPLHWSLDNVNWSEDLADIAETAINAGTESDPITVYWRWAFNGDDAVDTPLGETATAQPEITVKIVFTQID